MLGSGVAVARVVPALQELGWQPSVIFPEDGPLVDAFSGIDIVIADPPRPIGVSIRGWRRPPGVRQRIYQSRQYFASVRQGLEEQRPDAVHVNTLHALPEGYVARHLGLPIVLHAHEIPPPSIKRSLAIRGAGALADIVVPVSDTVKAMYAVTTSEARLMTVYNGVKIRPQVDSQEPLVIGTVGSICERKGTDILLQVATMVKAARPDIEFEHVGPSITSNEPLFERKLVELETDKALVAFLGPGDVDQALQRWSVFVLPSRQEAFPLATLEAMAAGLPVIASDVGGLAEQIIDGTSGILVPPNEPEALVRAITNLANDPGLRRQMGEAARERVAKIFTYERQAKGLNDAYMAALSRDKHPTRRLRAFRWPG
jgi:glycosyltransferase involved in cell wall biosynthesis